MLAIIILLGCILLAIIIGIILLIIRMQKEENNLENFVDEQYVLLEILVPRNNEKGPPHSESMFAALHGIFDPGKNYQDHISFEITSKNKYILFYCWAPERLKDFVEGQIYAQYPTVEIREAPEDYSLNLNANLKFAGTTLELNKSDVFPIKTFPNFEVDPLASITSVLSKVSGDQQVWIQLLVRPVSDDWRQKGISYVRAIKAGESVEKPSLSSRIILGAFDFTKEVVKTATTVTPQESGAGESEPPKLSGPEEEALSAIEQKVVKLGFEAKIRIVASAENEVQARSKLQNAVSAFKQFNATNINGFVAKEILTNQDILEKYQQRSFQKDGYILNIEELASIFHLPHITVETPSIAWAGAKKGEPPSNLPIAGTVDDIDLTLFGRTNFRHFNQKFGIKSRDRRLHFYAIGKTGTGKTTMLENMIIDDIEEGRGLAVVDPHGDLIEHILNFIPEKRIQDVIYFAPHDRQFPIGFNILEKVDDDLKSIVASGVVGVFKKIFGESWGPRLEYILRNTVLSLLDLDDATMLGITRVLVDKAYRKKMVDKIKDPVIKDFWVSEYEQYDAKFRTEAVAPIQNKVGQFLSTSTIRNIVGQSKSTIDIREIMDNKRIFLIDLAVGKVGEDVSSLLGAMMITKIQLAAMQRANVPEDERIDFYLYVDEFQNFATESFATILSEARKYHLNLIMTNQYIAQMPEVVRDAVFGNIGSLVSFRVGATDADFLQKEFEPVFDANDLVNMDNYDIYVKMAIDGVTSNAFSAQTLPPKTKRFGHRDQIIDFSRHRYSQSREEIEEKIQQWSNALAQENIETHKKDTVIGQERSEKIKNLGYRKIKSLTGNDWYVRENQKSKIRNQIENVSQDKAPFAKIPESLRHPPLAEAEQYGAGTRLDNFVSNGAGKNQIELESKSKDESNHSSDDSSATESKYQDVSQDKNEPAKPKIPPRYSIYSKKPKNYAKVDKSFFDLNRFNKKEDTKSRR
ncbi:MAG: hypothetical protein CEN89_230 [Candidatus Berkelbacteria bacterium Licking1014_7]|uniref:Uncharacterized protein n=1 Tax=Candidatus Berkelbacteria bacterium Licking1014_7 TaxID=2017147 RepID=A0A554LK28_9BACT|nr:MAG: hypothetical protein CEN89_230 [Candidatus Berkelbacteria bacterium Licking1014_7]